jgi:flagellar assembly protein FliH
MIGVQPVVPVPSDERNDLAAGESMVDETASAAAEAVRLAEQERKQREQRAIQEQLALEESRREEERKQIEEAFAKAREKGFAEGLAEGEREGQVALMEAKERLDKLARELEAKLEAGLAGMEEGAVAIVYEAVCKIIGETVITPAGVAAQVQQLLAREHSCDALTVRLHPVDLELVRGHEGIPPGGGRSINWVEDVSFAAGGCSVEGTSGRLEARLDSQLNRIKEALLAAHRPAVSIGSGAQ